MSEKKEGKYKTLNELMFSGLVKFKTSRHLQLKQNVFSQQQKSREVIHSNYEKRAECLYLVF